MDVTSMLNRSTVSLEHEDEGAKITSPPPQSKSIEVAWSARQFPTPSPDLDSQDRTQPRLVHQFHKTMPPTDGNSVAKMMQDISTTATLSLRQATETNGRSVSQQQSNSDLRDKTGRALADGGAAQLKSAVQTTGFPSYPHILRFGEPNDGRTGAPDFLGHKFSDSYSSLSSHGSHQSTSHSRVSSVTTLSGSYSSDLALAEVPENESVTGYQDSSPCSSTTKDVFEPEKLDITPIHGSLEGARRLGSPSHPALKAQGPIKSCRADTLPSLTTDGPFTTNSRSHKRAISAPDFPCVARPKQLPVPYQLHRALPPPRQVMAISEESLSPQLSRAAQTVDPGDSSHVYNPIRSLPFLQAIQGGDSWPEPHDTHFASASARPPPAHRSSTTTESSVDAVEQSIEGQSNDDEDGCRCMFVENCDTGSQLRKAISHLFGRNKTCTLKIPKHVWVYYCRKHYQRVRYRNARSYPVNQMELVQMQLERLQAWSEKNKEVGKGAFIKSWTLSLRKREEKRLLGSKAAATAGSDNGACHIGGAGGAGGQDQGQGGSAVPGWLVDELGEGYDTARVFAIAARLRKEIQEGTLAQVPEIEFLPDIVDDDEGSSTRPARLRKQNTSASNGGSNKTPKRKAPEFPGRVFGQAAMQTASVSASASARLPVYPEISPDADEGLSPRGKRARMVTGSELVDVYGANYSYSQRAVPYEAADQCSAEHLRRAQTIVPKIRLAEYHNQAHPSANYNERHKQCTLLLDGQDEDNYISRHGANEYGHLAAPDGANRYTPTTSAPRLPPIATGMTGSGLGFGEHELRTAPSSARPRLGRPGVARPLHQRSASAYTPMNRQMRIQARPLSSGNEGAAGLAPEAELPRQYGNGHGHGYGYGYGYGDPHGQQALGRYAQGQQGWAGDYAHGQNQNEFQAPVGYSHASGYGVAAGAGAQSFSYPEPGMPPTA